MSSLIWSMYACRDAELQLDRPYEGVLERHRALVERGFDTVLKRLEEVHKRFKVSSLTTLPSLTRLVCLRACAVKAGCSPYSQGSSEEEKAGSVLPDNKLHANNSIRLLCLYCWTSSLGELIGNDVKIAQAQPFCISSSKKDCRSWTLNHWRLAGRAANDWASCWSLQS